MTDVVFVYPGHGCPSSYFDLAWLKLVFANRYSRTGWDDFFLLGGDSLRGTRLLASVKAVFGVDIPIQSLFEKAATVAGMARAIEAARSGNAGADGKSYLRGQA